jgi:hypothetical protein
MLANKQSTRSLVSFLVAWSFVILTVTGIVLYVVPQGRVAYWIQWSLGGLGKEQWGWIHMLFGGVFIVSGVLHLYFNWNTFKTFLAARVKGHLKLKREALVATAITVVILVTAALRLPPSSWVIDLNDAIKAAWITSPELEPPFGHAEQVSLAVMATRMRLDLDAAMQALRERDLQFDGKGSTLETIARDNDTTPMAVFAIIAPHKADQGGRSLPRTREALEAELAGTGIGRQSLAMIADNLGIPADAALARLRGAGIAAQPEETAKAVADRQGIKPIDVVAAMAGVGAADSP